MCLLEFFFQRSMGIFPCKNCLIILIVLSLIVLVIAVTYLLCMFIVKCHRYLLINIVKSPNLERKIRCFIPVVYYNFVSIDCSMLLCLRN